MSRSRRWVHHVNFFQEPRVIVLCCVPCRMVSTTIALGWHATKQSVVPSGIYPVVREYTISPLRTRLIGSRP